MKKKFLSVAMAVALLFTALPVTTAEAATTGQYTNPLMNGADPTIVRGEDGYFYSGFGTDNDIYIKRSETLLGLSTAESHLVWDNPLSGNRDNNKNYYIWGPYIYHLEGAWYIYYSSSTENDFGYGHPSSYVLENTAADPFEGEWHLKGSNTNVDDFEGHATEKAGLMNTESYGLACGVVTIAGQPYFTYTKYDYFANEPGHTKFNECPTIVKMENPWTLTGPECTVARPTYAWEKHGDNIDEGCAYVEHDGKGYFAYSVSSFTNDNYGVGLSVVDLSSDVMDEKNWKKSTTPILSRSDENASFGPGSPLFVKSPDGTEDWLIYHGGPIGGQTSTDRRVRAQIVNWTDEGQINLGVPSNPDTVLDMPSGEMKTDVYEAEYASFGNVTKKLFNNTAKASGSGYMMFDQGNGFVEFDVDAASDGLYTLGFRYNNLKETVNARVDVNGVNASTVSFAKNGNFAVDLDEEKAYNIHLNAGSNRVRVSVAEPSGFALDTMIVTKAVKYEGVDAELSNGAFIEKGDHVGGMYNEDATVTFTVDVPYTGYYAVNLSYANGFSEKDGKKYASLYVNGEEIKKATVKPTGDWGIYGNRIDNLYLTAGTNTISYVNHREDGRNTGDVNYRFITVTECITSTYVADKKVEAAVVAQADDQEVEEQTTETEITEEETTVETPEAEEVEEEATVEEQSEVEAEVTTEAEESVETVDETTEGTDEVIAEDSTEPEAEEVIEEAEEEELVEALNVEAEDDSSDELTFTVNVESDGIYDLAFKSANFDSSKITLVVNGEVKNVAFNTNKASEAACAVKLTQGANKIELVGAKENAIEVASLHLLRRTPWHYQAENAAMKGVKQCNDHLFYNGTGFVGGFDSVGGSVEFITPVAYSSTHTVTVRYCGPGKTSTLSLYVNGNKVKTLSLPATESWDSWGEVTEELYLRAGKNRITLKRDDEDTGVLNVDEIVIDKFTTGQVTTTVGKLVPGEVYVIKAKNSTLSCDIDGYSPDAGKEIHLWYYLGNNNQKWKLVEMANGYWGFKGTYGSKFIRVDENKNIFTANENRDDEAQQWTLEKVGSCYKLINKKYNEALTVVNDSMASGAKLTVAPYEGKDSQLFYVDGGLLDTTTEVREISEEKSIDTCPSFGPQYELVDPKIPEPTDSYREVEDGLGLMYDAANALLESGARVENNHVGYKGEQGFVGGMYNGNAMMTFSIKADVAGIYNVKLGYCNGFGSDQIKKAAAYVNGKYVTAVELPSTGDWDSWGEASFNLELAEGVNKISFKNSLEEAGAKGDANYDYMVVSKYPVNVIAEATEFTASENGNHYELENTILLNGASIATDHKDYTGDGFVGGMYNGAANFGINIMIPRDDTYKMTIRYANGHGAEVENKVAAVKVNGKHVASVEFPKTGTWDDWSTVTFELALCSGMNNITFANSASLTGFAGDVNYDYLEVELNEVSEEVPGENPSETPGEEPTDPPIEAPEETPGETPGEGSEETPEDKPEETPGETPEEKPDDNNCSKPQKIVKAVIEIAQKVVVTVVKTIKNILGKLFR